MTATDGVRVVAEKRVAVRPAAVGAVIAVLVVPAAEVVSVRNTPGDGWNPFTLATSSSGSVP